MAMALMLRLVSPDWLQSIPSGLRYTPWSVPAATSVSAKANTRTDRPSRPGAADQVPPPSLLTTAPEPRVPATTSPEGNGLYAMVVRLAFPVWTVFQLAPPFQL